MFLQEPCELAQLLLATDERRGGCGKVAAPPAIDGDCGDRRVVGEDRFLQPPELRPRLEPELLGEDAPGLLERLERVGLAAAAVEREHQLPPEPLAEGVVCERRPQRRRELPVLPERKPGLEVLLLRVDAERLEAACLGREPCGRGQSLQSRTAPEGQRGRYGVRRCSDVAVAQRRARVGEELLETDGIDRRRSEGIAVGEADDRPLSERRAEAGDVVVKRIPRSGRELLPPETVDQRVDLDRAAVAEREHGQERLSLRAAHVRRRPADENLERAENPDFELFLHPRYRLLPRVSHADRCA